MIKKLSIDELTEAIESLPVNVQADLAATIQQRLAIRDHEHGRNADGGNQQSTFGQEHQETLKAFLTRMPDVGEDHEFVFARELPRKTDL